MQLGFYVQDKWTISDKLNVTYGLRADIPVFMTDLQSNERVAGETYRDGIKIDVSKYPSTKILLSLVLDLISSHWMMLLFNLEEVRGFCGNSAVCMAQ